jgi:hypothetical protein
MSILGIGRANDGWGKRVCAPRTGLLSVHRRAPRCTHVQTHWAPGSQSDGISRDVFRALSRWACGGAEPSTYRRTRPPVSPSSWTRRPSGPRHVYVAASRRQLSLLRELWLHRRAHAREAGLAAVPSIIRRARFKAGSPPGSGDLVTIGESCWISIGRMRVCSGRSTKATRRSVQPC